ncbi:DNA-binding transcriptional repressor FabR [uncultured Clostridium sp.]|nr:DNA-binding transcriptional repressor FabR [uncultured Clostridium sp.]SCJ07221.1 DNA-binding transcriptional repressor FabR [uncultured Clostridium sp.]
MKDKRVIKTQRSIRNAFISLIKEKNLNQITVAEISRKAELGRGTFYLHYKDVYDLYGHIEEELYNELEEMFDRSYPSCDPTNLKIILENITEYVEANKDIFLFLIQQDSNGKKVKSFFNKKVLESCLCEEVSELNKIESTFIVSGIVGVLVEWLENGLSIHQEEISNLLYKILLKL